MVHENGQNGTGDSGGRTGAGRMVRASMRLLQSEIRTATEVTEKYTESVVRLYREVMADPKATNRDKLRATEMLMALSKRGVDVAMYVDRMERVEAGEATDVVEHREYRIEFDRDG